MRKVGFIGWRGVVGSVLLERMQEMNDFEQSFEAVFFSTSQAGKTGPAIQSACTLLDAYGLDMLSECAILLSCQGSKYSQKILPALKEKNWQGYWIDAASAFRHDQDSMIVLDPINQQAIENAMASGIKKYIGGNCTVSLMLLAIGGLCPHISNIHAATYQAFSGAGSQMIQTYFEQIQSLGQFLNTEQQQDFLMQEKTVTALLKSSTYTAPYDWSLVGNLLPWIDKAMEDGSTKEEWKGQAETRKILDQNTLTVDSTCVRVGAVRAHSQSLHIELKVPLSMEEVTACIASTSPWTKVIENNMSDTANMLNPVAVSGTLNVHVGRIRALNKPNCIGVFTAGDQLLWGAAEPVRRMLNIVLKKLG